MTRALSVYVKQRIEAIQRTHNFSPDAGAGQLHGLPNHIAVAYGEFKALLTIDSKLLRGSTGPLYAPTGQPPIIRKLAREARPVHVYFARRQGTTHWKIGSSITPVKRVQAVQLGNDEHLHLTYIVEGGGRSMEARLKSILQPFKTRDRNHPHKGEWFDLPPPYVLKLVRLLRRKRSRHTYPIPTPRRPR